MKRHALLIGVDLYDDERITPLRYAGDDAWALAGAFVERCRFDEVIVLTETPAAGAGKAGPTGVRHGGRPTVKNIIDHLRRLATHLRDDSLFVFGFSGHGVEDNGREEAYLYAADSLADHHTVNSLPVGTLRDLLGRLPTRWQVLLLDACRNDPRAGKGDTDNPLGDVLAKNLVGFARNAAGTNDRHTAFLSACRRGQRAHEWPDFQHGVCSHYLLQGLAGPAWSGGRLTIRGLAHHAKTGMEGWQRAAGLQQEPWFEQSGTEDIVLGEQDTAQLAVEETAHQHETVAALVRLVEAQYRKQKAAEAALLAQIDAQQARIREVGERLAAVAEAERQRREAQEKAEAAQRERERQAREAEMARLAAAEQARTVAERQATFEKGYAAYQRIAQSSLPAEAKRNAWLDLCRRVGLRDQTEPVELVWKGDQVQVARSIRFTDYSKTQPFVNSLGMKFVPVVTSVDRKASVLFSVWATRVADYAAYAAAKAGVDSRWQKPGFAQGDTHPVVNVSWEDAQGFCAWLTAKERGEEKIGSNQTYRLPTDTEWSWAVGIGEEEERAGKDRSPLEKSGKITTGSHPWAFPWGKDWPPPNGAGNYPDKACFDSRIKHQLKLPIAGYMTFYDDGFVYTAPTGSFQPNQYGLFDLGSNVSEHVEGLCSGGSLTRGSSWYPTDYSLAHLSSTRLSNNVDDRFNFVGFRLMLVGMF